jgi:nitrate/TMAO reductase-like tetraheme cytochrome c subunit
LELQFIQEIDLMKKVLLVSLMVLAFGMFAMAQIQAPTTDVLGAHLNYGRGCAACHAPHSGARGNGIATADTTTGDIALWGQDVAPLFGKSYITGQSEHGSYNLQLPSTWNGADPVTANTLTCLSCHDGNYATGAMMKNVVYETVPGTYNSGNIPTLLGKDGNAPQGDYKNDHPVGDLAIVGCNGPYDWDCTISSAGAIQMTGPNSSKFVQNYGFFVSTKPYNSQPTVQCTTCHNQHLMNVVKVTQGATSGLPSGAYATMFFIRAPYNPASGAAGSNQTAQFCRQCHGGEANEMNGGLTIPTTF